MVVVFVREQDTDPATVRVVSNVEALSAPVSPQNAEEQGTGGSHDGDVWEDPVSVILWQVVDDAQKEGVSRYRAHGIVGDTRGKGLSDPGWV